MKKVISIRGINTIYDNNDINKFVTDVTEQIIEIEKRGNISEIHYSTALYADKYIQSALIIEKQR